MIKPGKLNLAAFLGTGAMLAAQLLAPNTAFAQTVTMNEAMLERCDAEGLSPETCACWFAAIAEAEGVSQLTEADIDDLAPDYQEELAACKEANQ